MSMKADIIVPAKRGHVLGTRALGAALGEEIREKVAGSHRALVVDFQGVDVASSPVLDEIACALRGAIADHPDRFVVLAHLNDDLRETMQLVLDARKMSLTAVSDHKLELLGGREHLDETLAEAQALGTFTAAELAQRLQLKLPNLHQRLSQLQAAGAVARVEAPAGRSGRATQFATPSARELVTA